MGESNPNSRKTLPVAINTRLCAGPNSHFMENTPHLYHCYHLYVLSLSSPNSLLSWLLHGISEAWVPFFFSLLFNNWALFYLLSQAMWVLGFRDFDHFNELGIFFVISWSCFLRLEFIFRFILCTWERGDTMSPSWLQIHTMGFFQIFLEGNPLTFTDMHSRIWLFAHISTCAYCLWIYLFFTNCLNICCSQDKMAYY